MSTATVVLPRAPAPVASTSRLGLHEQDQSLPVSAPETQQHASACDALPPYSLSAAPPPYVEREEAGNSEPNTLARQLFRYGFFFPLFWFVGACILASSLSPPANWEETKTEDERRELIAAMRAAEVKWSRRCLYASIALLFLVGAAVALAVLVPRLRR